MLIIITVENIVNVFLITLINPLPKHLKCIKKIFYKKVDSNGDLIGNKTVNKSNGVSTDHRKYSKSVAEFPKDLEFNKKQVTKLKETYTLPDELDLF